jgi:Raf kinase inhibitor-like YbhB/YbcL family protein
VAQFTLTSSAFQNGGAIPVQFTCDGANQSPPLSWGDPPPGAKSFALVVADPDAPRGTFRHWGAFDIPPTMRSLAAGQAAGAQALNDGGKPGYAGPCPPKGNGPHHYHFKLMAVNVPSLGLQPDVKVAELERAAEKHLVGRAELIGIYQR